MQITSLLKIYNTAKYLKTIQITNRILRKFKSVNPSKSETTLRQQHIDWISFPLTESCYRGNGEFCFLNMSDVVTDWNDERKPKLWLYNLHYFDDVNQNGWQKRTEIHNDLVNTWIAQNPFMLGNGWEPYPISLRSVNWIKWFLSGNAPKDEWLSSLSLQIQALDQQLEYHLLGNHLFANAKALVFAGCFFKGEVAEAWLKRGLGILDKEVREQIMGDGGHFELTPMYHNTILADILDLYQLSLVYPDCIPSRTCKYWKGLISKMCFWADSMEHPDGDVSFFNDSAIGIAPKLSTLRKYALELEIDIPSTNQNRITHLQDSGYIVIQDGINKLIIDVANVGPDYIPGHAHADTLSFELSIEGQRVLVNSGTSVYGLGEERLRQRKTESHNTVIVDGADSSEVWSGFRVAKRAYPTTPIINETDNKVCVECSHNGYMRLQGKVMHKRQWQIERNVIAINDKLSGHFNSAQAHYHLHPDIVLDECGPSGSIFFTLPNGAQYAISVMGGSITVVDSSWHPEFGLSIPNKKLILNFEKDEVEFVLARE
ncbi:heparinase II/III family protein [Vibrio fluvialis]|uniref:heparinase II/III family protein n=1 Tax=Vibrio fluvialis TaxID=676 RepID=UPI001F478312|nr:heparinase II/III family protein [Vibrio fluvialis]MCE7595922.1 heparinase II/III family protein [Vibrio fluvialis]